MTARRDAAATPGCAGTIDDGYCDDCGLAPAVARRHDPHRRTGRRAPPMTSTRAARRAAPRRSAGAASAPGWSTSRRCRRAIRQTAVMTDPTVAEHRRFCSQLRRAGRSQPRRTARAHRGLLRRLRHAVLVRRVAGTPGSSSPGSTRSSGASPTVGSAGSTWPATTSCPNDGSSSRACSTAVTSTPWHAALAERRFLAEVEHPNIVKIHNFVEHQRRWLHRHGVRRRRQPARRSWRPGARPNGGRSDPLPVEQAIAFCLEILPALGHLHELGLVFCDFKPDNVIHSRGAVKLIDLGGVYRLDDQTSPVYGTVGYQAPEIAADRTRRSPSDLFTVGRTLAVLATDFVGYQSIHRYTLAARHVDAAVRPLRLAVPVPRAGDGAATPTSASRAPRRWAASSSACCGRSSPPAARRRRARRARASRLPPAVRSTSPTGGRCRRRWSTPTIPVAAVIVSLARPRRGDPAARRAGRDGGGDATCGWPERYPARPGRATPVAVLDGVEAADPLGVAGDLVPRARRAQHRRRRRGARRASTRVYRTLPGELAPKLALGDDPRDRRRSGSAPPGGTSIVARTDPTFTTASFGLARCRTTMGDRVGAIAAYEPGARHLERARRRARSPRPQLLLDDAGTRRVCPTSCGRRH